MLLQHIHYPSRTAIPYIHALHIQEIFARQHLNHKASVSRTRHNAPKVALSKGPSPTLLTFSTKPTYTTGLRDSRSLTPQQIASLTETGATHHASPRGGLTTYHGPGQLTAFLITTLAYHNLSPRCYVHFLEDAVIRTASLSGVTAFRWSPALLKKQGDHKGEDESRPGVWTSAKSKLCSVGIHFRRGVSSFGLGFNVTEDVSPWFERITACGIPDSHAVSLAGEQKSQNYKDSSEVDIDAVAKTLARVVTEDLDGIDDIKTLDPRSLGQDDE